MSTEENGDGSEKKKKKCPIQPGIIYLSSIPPQMNVQRIKQLFAEYGHVDRVFLQRQQHHVSKGRKLGRYAEGWIEFKDKSIAKRVAASLNNTQVGGKKRAKAYESIWNIRYLNRFKWHHLTDQLTYEKTKHKQRMQIEIAQAKRQAKFFTEQVEKGQSLLRLEKEVLKKEGKWERYKRQHKQRKVAVHDAPIDNDRSELLKQIL